MTPEPEKRNDGIKTFVLNKIIDKIEYFILNIAIF